MVAVAGEEYELYSRDIIQCIRALYGDATFAPHLIFVPECHYDDNDRTTRLFHDMHTGRWWWDTQVSATFFSVNSFSLIFLTESPGEG